MSRDGVKIDQKMELSKQQQICRAMSLLAKSATRENQRLDAMRCAFTAQLAATATQQHWTQYRNAECGAILELDRIRIPFGTIDGKKRKPFRRAIYVVCRVGDQVRDSELYTFGKECSEVSVSNKIVFSDVDPAFQLSLELYGMELPDKERLKGIDPNGKFVLWARVTLTAQEMDKKIQRKRLEVRPNAPRAQGLTGYIHFRMVSAIPVFCDVAREGFLNFWAEEGEHLWRFIYVKLRDGKLTGYDPSGIDKKKKIIEIEITGQLKISESSKKRANSFQLRDFNGRTILAASTKEEMHHWMATLRKHKAHLKK